MEWGEGVGGRCLRFPENEKGRKVLGGFESPAPLSLLKLNESLGLCFSLVSREWKVREGTLLLQSCASAAVGGRRAFRNCGRTRLALCHYSVGEVGGLRCSNAKKQVLSQTHS